MVSKDNKDKDKPLMYSREKDRSSAYRKIIIQFLAVVLVVMLSQKVWFDIALWPVWQVNNIIMIP